MKKVILFVALSLSIAGYSQGGSYSYEPGLFKGELSVDTSLTRILNESEGYKSLNEFERGVVYSINYARKKAQLFMKEALTPYLAVYPQLKANYGASLVKELSAQASLSPLNIDARLVKAATGHAKDLAKTQTMSHNSSNGTSFQQRLTALGISCGSECINAGMPVSPLEVVLSLLIDFNVSGTGHRKALLNPTMTYVGVSSIKSDKNKLNYTVIDMGCF